MAIKSYETSEHNFGGIMSLPREAKSELSLGGGGETTL